MLHFTQIKYQNPLCSDSKTATTVLWHSLVKWLSLSIIILQSCSGNILFCRHSTCVFIDKIPVSCTVSCITAYRSSAHFLRALSCDIRTWARDEWESRWVSTKGTNEITLFISSRISECWLQWLSNCSGMLLHAEILTLTISLECFSYMYMDTLS